MIFSHVYGGKGEKIKQPLFTTVDSPGGGGAPPKPHRKLAVGGNESTKKTTLLAGQTHPGICCHNEKCITNQEHYLPKSFVGTGTTLTCEYCDERLLLRH